MKRSCMAALLMACMLVFGCNQKTTAPTMADGSKNMIMVLFDRGIEDSFTPKQVEWRNEVGTFMEADLVNRLNRTGYSARLIQARSEYTPAKGVYLLPVKITSYNPGSQAARYLVGFGAGACGLDIHYELIDDSNTVLISMDDGAGSSRGWRPCVQKLDNNIVAAIGYKL
ncbi:DUF4410 domain-containing protein [uncultured Desulfobacter sp.]|uniref:DUF4410 domain-containing protein n=1 Tax=uncultured Desulfobacter sp. TaxID=240139 RepID=UPI002AAC32A0|nr:DUF4410 domain-containing protein [uncultured Desulfobacter sp.]